MNSGRSFGRHEMSSSVNTWLTIAPRDLHRRRDLAVDEVQRHLHVDLAVLVDALEVDVQDLVLERMHLHVAQQHLRRRAVELHRQDRRVERLVAQRVEQRVVVELDRLRARRRRRRRCRAPCPRGACGGSRRGLRCCAANAVNSNCMMRLPMSAAFRCAVAAGRAPGRSSAVGDIPGVRRDLPGKALKYNLILPGRQRCRPRLPASALLHEQRAHRLLVRHARHRLGEQLRARELRGCAGSACASSVSGIVSVTTSSSSSDVGDARRPRRRTAPGACNTRRPSSRRAPSAPSPPCTACSRCRPCRP